MRRAYHKLVLSYSHKSHTEWLPSWLCLWENLLSYDCQQLWLTTQLTEEELHSVHGSLAKNRPLSLISTTCQSIKSLQSIIHSVRKQMLYDITGWLLSPWLLFMFSTAFFSCFKQWTGQNTILKRGHVYFLLSIVKLNVLAWRLRSVSGVCSGGVGTACSANAIIHKTIRFSSWSLAGK